MHSLAATAGYPQVHREAQERVLKLLQYGCPDKSSQTQLLRRPGALTAALTCQSVLAAAALERISAAVLRGSASSASACQLCTCRHSSLCKPFAERESDPNI